MKVLIVDTDYPGFVSALYAGTPGLAEQGYERQHAARVASLFGMADFYSRHLVPLGYDAIDLFPSCEPMQRAWAREHGVSLGPQNEWFLARRRGLPLPARRKSGRWFEAVLEAQVRHFRPDILFNHALAEIPPRLVRSLRAHARFVVGQIASPIPEGEDWSCYDLVLSSLPNLVQRFRSLGVRAEPLALGFEPTVRDAIGESTRTIPVSFVGSLSPLHRNRFELLTWLAERVPELEIWGQGPESLDPSHPLRRRFRGAATGRAMFGVLARSRVTLNCHLDLAGPYANNMRLFEATGMGALLVTDRKENLRDLFEPERDVLTYASPEECLEKIRHALAHPDEAAAIARRGSDRARSEHSYAARMRQLDEILKRTLA